MVEEKFQIYGVNQDYWQIHLWVKKLNLFIVTHAPKPNPNSCSEFYHYPPGSTKLPIPLEGRFLKIYFFPSREAGGRGGGGDCGVYAVEKDTKIKPTRVLSTILINSTIFATFTILVSVLLCHNLASSMLKCEGSLT